MRYVVAAGICACFAMLATEAGATEPHASWNAASVGNGFGFGVYDGNLAKVTTFTEAPHATLSPTQPTRNLMYDAYFGVRADGEGAWLNATPVATGALSYEKESGVAAAVQSVGPLKTTTHVFMPFGLKSPALVMALEATNVSSIAQPDAAAYVLLNLHLGSGAPAPGADGEHVTWDGTSFTETGNSGLSVHYVPIGAIAHHGATPNNPFPIVSEGGDLIDTSDSGVTTDAVAGYQWSLAGIAPGETRWVGVVITLGSAADATSWIAGRSADAIVQQEIDDWESWRKPPPAGLSAKETQIWRQSEAVLRMAQSREPAPANGQIVAAMPPGQWWITWVRDMSYATAALARSGHTDEANAAIQFWKHAKVGAYESYVGHPYYVSVVRYFGDGEEESDSNADGPNIEFDGFGLSTWAAHAAKSTDMDANADVLSALVDPANGLISADSSIWEVHWNGKQKHYAYTSIAAARALCDAGNAKGALAMRDAILKNLLLPSGGLAQSLEELQASGGSGTGAHDAAVIEAINFGLINPLGAHAQATFSDLSQLAVPTGYGYYRNDDGGGYDSQEWGFIDLRIADAMMRAGMRHESARLLGWVIDNAALNLGLMPELLHRENGDYAGAVPMVGFGAGATMLALMDRADDVVGKTDPCFPKEGPDVIVPEPVEDAGVGDAAASDAQPNGDAATSDAGVDGASPDADVSSNGGGGKSGCSCTDASSSDGESALFLSVFAIGAALVRRRRGRALVAAVMASAAIGCASGDDASSKSDTGADAGGDVVLVDTNLPGDAPPHETSPDAPPSDAPTSSTLPLRDCSTSFTYALGRSAKVEIVGEWDGFTAHTAMTDGLGTGTYRVSLDLKPGSYGYKFLVDGTDYQFDPATKYTRYVAGIENSRVDVGDCHAPELDVVASSASPSGVIDLDLQYVDGADAKGPDASSLQVSMAGAPVPSAAIAFDTTTGKLHVHVSGLSKTKYTFTFDVADRTGKKAETRYVPMWVEDEPFQWTDGPLYFVFTDRFRNGDTSNDTPEPGVDPRANYQGGDYAGVLASLKDGYFDKLGVRSIWLSPVNENSKTPGVGSGGYSYSAYHGYWVDSPNKVEPHWGSIDDLKAVIQEAHKHGIRVIFDIAQNQLHQEHPYYKAHKDWFNGDGTCVCGGPSCDWNVHRLDCWFEPYLPDVNWTNMDAVEAMIGDGLQWLIDTDADGFRIDAVKHMQDIATTTLRIRLSRTLETGNARYYLVGETFDDRPLISHYIGPQQLWGQFDFPLYYAIDYAFAQSGGAMTDLDGAVTASESAYGPDAVMSPILGNQDVPRFLSRAAGQVASDTTAQAWTSPPSAPTIDDPYDRMFLAYVFLLTQRGVPLIYYGDEIGMPGTGDPDNRRFMRFGSDLSAREQHLFDRVTTVAKARGTLPGLRRGARRTLHTDGDGYVYARGAGPDTVLVALNRGSTSRAVSVAIPADLAAEGTVFDDMLGGPSVTVTGGAIDVPFTPKGASLFYVHK